MTKFKKEQNKGYKMIWAIILAAGESKRMRKPKLLLPLGEKTIIETVIQNVILSKVNEILVVLGSSQDKIEQKIENLPIKIVANPHFSKGMLSSIQCGIKSIPENAQAVLIILGDQPSISSDIINKIIDSFKSTNKGIILPVHNNKRGHPVLIDNKYRDEFENLNPEIGLRELIHNHTEDIMEVELNVSNIHQNINDMDDYKKELKNRSFY